MRGWIDRSERARVLVRGGDRVRFLHNLTTQDVKGLAVGRGAEAFVTSPQGKTLAYVTLHVLEDAILVRADAGGLDEALPHLRKYGVFDEVELEPIEERTWEWHVVADEADARLAAIGMARLDEGDLSCRASGGAAGAVVLIRESPGGVAGWTLIGPKEGADALAGRVLAGLPEIAAAEFEGWRIRAGTPRWGREVTVANLPQEIGRDARAISFTKGCYLGQETVARLDALGHVNKLLRGLIFDGMEAPAEGAVLWDDQGKAVGSVTSAAAGAGGAPAVGLGYVRVRSAEPGTVLRLEGGRSVRVSGLPIAG